MSSKSAYIRFSLTALLCGCVFTGALCVVTGCTVDEPSLSPDGVVPPVRVIDGDTLDIGSVRHRLHGIDAPETGEECRNAKGARWPCGAVATRYLAALVKMRPLRCEPVEGERDRYGRTISRCTAGKLDIGTALVRAGLARAFRRYADVYVSTESEARRGQFGIWHRDGRARPKADPANRQESDSANGNCLIKGNVSRNGLIYHLPGSRAYARTRIDVSRGERWFCSEHEARAAGWRAPR